MTASSSGKYAAIDNIAITAGPSGPVVVTGVTVSPTSVSIEAGQTSQLTATVSPTNADDTSVSWSSSNTAVATVDANGLVTAVAVGTADITVTTTDGNKTATCAVTVTAPPTPIDVTAISLTDATVAIGDTKTLTVTYTPTDANTGKAVTWSSSNTAVATIDANGTVTGVAAGTATITATSTTDESITASCTITVQAVSVTAVSLDKSTASIQIGGSTTLTATIQPTNATNKNVSWSSSNTAVATVSASGVVTGIAAGTATITATTEDGSKSATCTVTVTAGPPLPETTLTKHVPEVYEAKEIAGGYNTTLVNYNQREYEVFYLGKSKPAGASSDIAVTYTLNHKGGYLVSSPSGSGTSITAKDGWFKATISSLEGSFKDASEIQAKASARDEFADLPGDFRIKDGKTFELHIQGYDQFSIVAQDKKKDASGIKPDDDRYWEVYIDGILQPQKFNKDNATTRRYDITTGRHVISLKAIGGEESKLYGFSLRVAQEPRTKWNDGNDSTQKVLQTQAISPIIYTTKYNNIPGAETQLIWEGDAATGITLTKLEGTLTDTLVLSGTANCAIGEYNYAIVAYYNGIETSRATGKFYVKTDIRATSETYVEVYKDEEMDEITFRYYALSADNVQLTWTDVQPTGITGSGAKNNVYVIGGTPKDLGEFPFQVTIAGADTIIKGKIVVKELNYGDHPVLYLYKNLAAYDKDGVYKYLKTTKWDLITHTTSKSGLRDSYDKYEWILISEDADANNAEIIEIIRGGVNKPVLNMNGFAYSKDSARLGWGDPDNGAIDSSEVKTQGCYINVRHADHPIFSKFSSVQEDQKIAVLSDYELRGVMPIAISLPGTMCLGTAPTRSSVVEGYYSEGPLQTAIHEIPADMRGAKYICLPMGSKSTLSEDGKKLIDGVVEYLTSSQSSPVSLPELRITSFTIKDEANNKTYSATIDDSANTIQLELTTDEYEEMDSLRAVKPIITVADEQYTYVSPASGDEVKLMYTTFMPALYTVSDYISKKTYSFSIRLVKLQGIDEVYSVGEWVNIYDIYGRKVTTTNEDIYTMSLPHGIYIAITDSGETIKIMK